ncbi:MAG: NUDIX domain-containing protein [Candidatus Woesearchaeota archaeon]
MNKYDQLIMVVKTKVLLGQNTFQGFKPQNQEDFETKILKNYEFIKRGIAEEDPNYKQPIAYAIILNPQTKKIFTFQRAKKDKNYTEKRLQGKWALGVGGHIEKIDDDSKNPIYASMLREINEEVNIHGKITPKIIGYINDDSNSVGKVHFGIIYIIQTDAEIITPKDAEMESGKLITMNELEQLVLSRDEQIEEWTKIALNPLKKYFNNNN